MPENAVYVGRPTKWGNPYIAETEKERAIAVENYRDWVESLIDRGVFHDLAELRGKDLACWCPLHKACHADVLLELANSPKAR